MRKVPALGGTQKVWVPGHRRDPRPGGLKKKPGWGLFIGWRFRVVGLQILEGFGVVGSHYFPDPTAIFEVARLGGVHTHVCTFNNGRQCFFPVG